MSCDKLVLDLSQEVEGSPNIFVKKDWITILDNQNQNYNSNQSVIDTSQLSNSNKYMSYREAYFLMPLLLTLSSNNATSSILAIDMAPNTTATSCDYALGLKSWFGNMIHSFTVDYQGSTVIQSTAFVNMWNCFRLLTSLSYNDLITIGSTIGFYPDDPLSFGFNTSATVSGQGTCNNNNIITSSQGIVSVQVFNQYNSNGGNIGFQKRQQYINYDDTGICGNTTFANQFTTTQCQNLWKSYISKKQNAVASTSQGVWQCSIMATIYLKHLHSFFQSMPLLKGAFMKMTLNLNNCSAYVSKSTAGAMTITQINNAVGGVCPLMIASGATGNGGEKAVGSSSTPSATVLFIANVSVGNRVIDSVLNSSSTVYPIGTGTLGGSVQLFVPSYTFNPAYENAYISSPIKQINYTDIYQYQILNIASAGTINNLVTNGTAGLKSVLIIPFYSSGAGSSNTGIPTGIPVYQSPFDPAGCGTTSPLALLTNFNVVISGQNAIYSNVRYNNEMFNNQVLGANAVNGALTDGLTSSLFNSLGFEMGYCYYYVDVSRMLPVEMSVPKSVQIIGTNASAKALDLFVFLEYSQSIQVDILSSARV